MIATTTLVYTAVSLILFALQVAESAGQANNATEIQRINNAFQTVQGMLNTKNNNLQVNLSKLNDQYNAVTNALYNLSGAARGRVQKALDKINREKSHINAQMKELGRQGARLDNVRNEQIAVKTRENNMASNIARGFIAPKEQSQIESEYRDVINSIVPAKSIESTIKN